MKVVILLALLFITSCSSAADEGTQKGKEKKIGMPNPASVKCVEDGHKLEIRTGPGGGQMGVCIDKDGNECGEWAYFRGECKLNKEMPR